MKLLLADDHTLFRDALMQYIERAEPDSRITLAKDLPGVFTALAEDQPDLVLLDLRMPGMNGMEGFRTLQQQYPQVRLALMSGVAEKQDVENAMDLGAVGYFPKTLSGKALLQGIQRVLSGELFVPVDTRRHAVLPSYYNDAPAKAAMDVRLTPREKDVLEYLGKGFSNKDIAGALKLQVVTIKLHVRGICRKLEAENRTQAVVKAYELGLIS